MLDADAGAGSPILFDITTPGNDDNLRANIAHAMSLGLPEADGEDLQQLNIIANGPSALGMTFGRKCMAVNGALGLFPKSAPPALWIGCDPQALLADFVRDGPEETTYLVASKCHPAVFEALKGRDVRLWHVNDIAIPNVRQVPCAVSVTLCAMMLAHRLGFRKLDLYGWDCCFAADGTHHAGSGELSATPGVIDVLVGDPEAGPTRTFKTTPTWACEAQDAAGILPVLRWCGTEVVIHGGGMVGAIIEEFAERPSHLMPARAA